MVVTTANSNSNGQKPSSTSLPPPPNAAAGSAGNGEESSELMELKKAAEEGTTSINECNKNGTINYNDTNNCGYGAESESPSEEMLSVVPQILRSVLERSRRVEEDLIRQGDAGLKMMAATTAVAPLDGSTKSIEEEAELHRNEKDAAAAIAAEEATTSPSGTNPLSIPPTWKRTNYASKSLSEIEEDIAKSNKIPRRDLFNVQYNECSLLALANWAMMGYNNNLNNNNNTSITATTTKAKTASSSSSWEQYKNEQLKRRASCTTEYIMPVTPPNAFRMCGVCRRSGHYELECDLLCDYDNDVDNYNDGNDKEKKRKRLDVVTKNKVISNLAKEIRIQRTLHMLLVEAKKKMMKKGGDVDDDHVRNDNDGSDDDDDDDHSSYWVTSQRCNICLSALGAQSSILVCDGCDELYHMHCLDPPLDHVPEGDWYCDVCQACDDDMSSTVDIEGCGGFVIEQRKYSVAAAEEEKRRSTTTTTATSSNSKGYVGVSLGGDNPWIAALSILSQKEPDVEDMANFKAVYMRKDNCGSEFGLTDFVVDEVVWAKRQVGRIKYWPGIISKVAKKGLDVKYFPLDDNNLDRLHHQSELLPFFPYFEELGYDYEQVQSHDPFRRAVELSVIKTGLKTFGQALNFARSGTQASLFSGNRNTTAARFFKSSGWTAPIGWENANIDEVDGIMILSRDDCDDKRALLSSNRNPPKSSSPVGKSLNSEGNGTCEICRDGGDLLVCDGGDNGGGCDKTFHVACVGRNVTPEGEWICMSCAKNLGFKNVGVEGKEWGCSENSSCEAEETGENTKTMAEFRVDEIVGSIVSWQQVTRPKTCYGEVQSVDVEAKTALVRAIPMLSDSSENYESLFLSQPLTQTGASSIPIQASDMGSTMWMPLSTLSFVSGKAAERQFLEFKETLSSHMAQEITSFESRCREAEIERERFTIELSHTMSEPALPVHSAPSPPEYSHQNSTAPGLIVVRKSPSGMLQCPKCSFVTEHRCGMSNHAKYCLGGIDYTYAE